jgi:uncharacterized protein
MQKAVEIKRDGLTLRGMAHIPENSGEKCPGVIILHGFTGNKMEPHFIFVKLSRALEKAGIASVRFDFTGSGESDGDFKDMTPDSELADANYILDYLIEQDFIDKDRIGICGLSMGGYIGGITAGDNRDNVKGLCMWAPAGNIGDLFLEREKDWERIEDGLFDIQGLLLSSRAYESAALIDHISRTSVFDREACIIHGTCDTTVPYDIGLQYKKAMKNAEFHSIEGANHTFDRTAWENQVINITVDFFRRVL